MRLPPKFAILAIGAFLTIFFAAQVDANLRAPMQHHSASTSPGGPAPEVTVLKEELDFRCDQQGCLVRARYFVTAGSVGSWRMSFVLPEPGRVKVTVGDSVIMAASRRVAWKDPYPKVAHRNKLPLLHYMPQMNEAIFDLNLPKGGSTLDISYRQQWGREERRFQGYFSGWLAARILRYELWPLNSWRLSRSFTLKVKVMVKDDRIDAGLLRIAESPAGESHNLRLLPANGQGVFNGIINWGTRFPARLELVVGSAEAMESYGIKKTELGKKADDERWSGDP